VPISTIAKFGPLDSRNNRWTRPENMVCNGAFILKKWRLNDVIVVTRNTNYWDAEKVRLREVRFYPIESQDTEERAFRSGQLHVTYDMPLPKIPAYHENAAALLRIDPYLGTYFYRVNVTKPELKDVRVRRALAMAIDRDALVRDVTRGGEVPAHSFVPPGAAGFHGSAAVPSDIPAAKKLFAEAGYPDGKGFPKLEIHYNTLEKHKIIAEAIQEMWRKNLGIDVHLINQEWKVYTDTQRRLDYQIGRYGWIGDYVDPNSFMDLMVTGGGNNQTGYSNPEYDRLVHEAACTIDQKRRYVYFDEAEKILMNDLPVLPIFFYTKPFLIRPSVHGWNPTILDHHPLKYVYLEPDVAQTARR
jgi:oligopeptide transport system substrate-binding protein